MLMTETNHIYHLLKTLSESLSDINETELNALYQTYEQTIFPSVSEKEKYESLILACRTRIELEPQYSYLAARILNHQLHLEAANILGIPETANNHLFLEKFIQKGVQEKRLNAELLTFNLTYLSDALDHQRNDLFQYLGLQTLYDRYFIHMKGTRYELPQIFFMRIAMGLALNEKINDRDQYAIDFYNVMSKFEFMPSTPTLFNAGTQHPQLSSCYLTTIEDDLGKIYDAFKENALLAKYSGGLGNDWSNIRSMGAQIKSTNGESQGLIPFLNVADANTVAVNQGGKRKGATCAYLEIWHQDIEAFLELRKNTGDDRRRTHDMNTANWIPDLFMQRLRNNQNWTLFSPNETPLLHQTYGEDFKNHYEQYETKAKNGLLSYKSLPAKQLWRKMLSMLFETGHPWITFKDPCNLRSPQQHCGIIHSSNLCTEITLNTSKDEIAVCNLGSINLCKHINIKQQALNTEKLAATIHIAIRMLDNVIDLNYYPVQKARTSNLKHRPIGLGLMGFHDALYQLNIPYASEEAVTFSDQSMELISYHAIQSSIHLAQERGVYPSYKGSLWDQGIFPLDSIKLLKKHRAPSECLMNENTQFMQVWHTLKTEMKQSGIRNSNIMAIAPTATIANICGVSQSIEPNYKNLFVKSNLSGEFTVINPFLIDNLKRKKLWNSEMLQKLKQSEGSIQNLPTQLFSMHEKHIFKTAFEIEAKWLIKAASGRQKWIDQSQSLNLYMNAISGKQLSDLYTFAWEMGLKTTYYLRTLGASHAEKSTYHDQRLNAVNVCPLSSTNSSHCEVCE